MLFVRYDIHLNRRVDPRGHRLRFCNMVKVVQEAKRKPKTMKSLARTVLTINSMMLDRARLKTENDNRLLSFKARVEKSYLQRQYLQDVESLGPVENFKLLELAKQKIESHFQNLYGLSSLWRDGGPCETEQLKETPANEFSSRQRRMHVQNSIGTVDNLIADYSDLERRTCFRGFGNWMVKAANGLPGENQELLARIDETIQVENNIDAISIKEDLLQVEIKEFNTLNNFYTGLHQQKQLAASILEKKAKLGLIIVKSKYKFASKDELKFHELYVHANILSGQLEEAKERLIGRENLLKELQDGDPEILFEELLRSTELAHEKKTSTMLQLINSKQQEMNDTAYHIKSLNREINGFVGKIRSSANLEMVEESKNVLQTSDLKNKLFLKTLLAVELEANPNPRIDSESRLSTSKTRRIKKRESNQRRQEAKSQIENERLARSKLIATYTLDIESSSRACVDIKRKISALSRKLTSLEQKSDKEKALQVQLDDFRKQLRDIKQTNTKELLNQIQEDTNSINLKINNTEQELEDLNRRNRKLDEDIETLKTQTSQMENQDTLDVGEFDDVIDMFSPSGDISHKVQILSRIHHSKREIHLIKKASTRLENKESEYKHKIQLLTKSAFAFEITNDFLHKKPSEIYCKPESDPLVLLTTLEQFRHYPQRDFHQRSHTKLQAFKVYQSATGILKRNIKPSQKIGPLKGTESVLNDLTEHISLLDDLQGHLTVCAMTYIAAVAADFVRQEVIPDVKWTSENWNEILEMLKRLRDSANNMLLSINSKIISSTRVDCSQYNCLFHELKEKTRYIEGFIDDPVPQLYLGSDYIDEVSGVKHQIIQKSIDIVNVHISNGNPDSKAFLLFLKTQLQLQLQVQNYSDKKKHCLNLLILCDALSSDDIRKHILLPNEIKATAKYFREELVDPPDQLMLHLEKIEALSSQFRSNNIVPELFNISEWSDLPSFSYPMDLDLNATKIQMCIDPENGFELFKDIHNHDIQKVIQLKTRLEQFRSKLKNVVNRKSESHETLAFVESKISDIESGLEDEEKLQRLLELRREMYLVCSSIGRLEIQHRREIQQELHQEESISKENLQLFQIRKTIQEDVDTLSEEKLILETKLSKIGASNHFRKRMSHLRNKNHKLQLSIGQLQHSIDKKRESICSSDPGPVLFDHAVEIRRENGIKKEKLRNLIHAQINSAGANHMNQIKQMEEIQAGLLSQIHKIEKRVKKPVTENNKNNAILTSTFDESQKDEEEMDLEHKLKQYEKQVVWWQQRLLIT